MNNKIKSGHLFWGLFFIALGILYMYDRFEGFYSAWDFVYDYWPVGLVLWGAYLLTKNHWSRIIVAVFSGVFAAILFYGYAANIMNFTCSVDEDFDFRSERYKDASKMFTQGYDDDVKFVDLSIEAGAGEINIAGGTNDLIVGEAKGFLSELDFFADTRDSSASIDFEMPNGNISLMDDFHNNSLDLHLNENVVWNIDLEVGAARNDFDLRKLKVNHVKLKTGATNTDLTLGDRNDFTKVDVEIGAAVFKLRIPENTGCKLVGNMILMAKDLDDFNKYDDNYYLSENYKESTNKIEVSIDGGASKLKIERY